MAASRKGALCLCVLGTLCLLSSANSQMAEPLVCPASISSTVFDNGTIVFGPLSEGSGPVDASFDPGAIGGWNALANGFVDAVRSGGLPYNILIPAVNATIPGITSGQSIDPLSLLNSLASWWAGILVVTLLGILVGVLFLIVGACFWCCRCCGNCGGAKTQRAREKNDCITFTFAAILLFWSLILLAAAVLAFFSNEQTFRSVSNIQTTLNSVVQNANDYLTDTTREVDDLICQFGNGQDDDSVLGAVVGEVDEIVNNITGTVNDISMELSSQIDRLNSSVIREVTSLLQSLDSSLMAITATVGTITTNLGQAATDLNTASSDCMATGIPLDTCNPIGQVAMAITTSQSDIPAVPDLGPEVSAIQNATSGLGGQIMDGQNALFDALGPQVMEQINSTVAEIDPILAQVNETLPSISTLLHSFVDPINNNSFPAASCPPLDGFEAFNNIYVPQISTDGLLNPGSGSTAPAPATPPAGQFLLTLGYINECIINAAFNYIGEFDVYRYAVGIVICCLALITIALVWLGLLLGMIGFRKDRYPYDRSNVSHCGGIILLIAVGLTFLFGFFLLLLSGIFFFLGSNTLKFCQALEGPNYELYANTIDNPDVIRSFTQGQPNEIFNNLPSISGLLRGCEQNNTALYTAVNINGILSATIPDVWAGSIEATISRAYNLSELRATIDMSIGNVADNLNVDQMEVTMAITDALNMIPSDSIDANLTNVFRDSLNTAVASANFNNSIETLRNASTDLTNFGLTDPAAVLNSVATTLENIRDVLIPQLLMDLTLLESNLTELSLAAERLRQNVTGIANDISGLVTELSGPILNNFVNVTVREALDRTFGFFNQYIQHLDVQLSTSVAGCQPVYGIYTQLHNSVCRNFLEGLNGFWWSLGFCALLFIPVIIFAVLASSFFLKKKSKDGDDDGYLDYPMKSY